MREAHLGDHSITECPNLDKGGFNLDTPTLKKKAGKESDMQMVVPTVRSLSLSWHDAMEWLWSLKSC